MKIPSVAALILVLVSTAAAQPVIWPAELGLRQDPALGGRLKVRLAAGIPREIHASVLAEAGCSVLYAVLPWEQSLTAQLQNNQPRRASQDRPSVAALQLEEELLRTYVVAYQDAIPPEKAIAFLRVGCSTIEVAEPVHIYQLAGVPNDSLSSEQEMLATIRAYDAWDVEGGSAGVTIGISDSGILQEHEDLAPQLFVREGEIPDNGVDDDGNGYIDDYRGYNFCTSDDGTPPGNTFNSTEGHGTGVAGICAAAVNNGIGIAGVAGACTIVPLKTMPNNVPGIVYGYESIMYCALNNVQVVNCSWGGYSPSCINESIIRYAIERNVAIVAAAGNHGSATPFYPGSYHGVLNVGVTDAADNVISMSGHGPTVDVMAPGQGTITTSNDGTYGGFCCTSGSSPIVAAVVGLVRSRYPEYSARQALATVKASATPAPWTSVPATIDERLLPKGRVDVLAAVTPDSARVDLEVQSVNVRALGDSRWTVGDTISVTPVIANTLRTATVGGLSMADIIWPTPLQPLRLLPSTPDTTSRAIEVGDSLQLPSLSFVVQQQTDASAFVHAQLRVDTELFDLVLPVTPAPEFRTIHNDVLAVSLGDRGRMGNTDLSRGQGAGLTFKQYCGQLYESGLMVSVGDRVVDAVRASRGTNDHFRPVKRFVRPDTMVAVVNDGDAPDSLRSGVELEQRVWMAGADSAAIVIDLTVTNRSDTTWPTMSVAYFSDWDLGTNPSRNRGYVVDGEANRSLQIATSVVPDEPAVALGVSSVFADARPIAITMDNTATYQGFSMAAKWALLNQNTEQYTEVNDIATVTGIHFSDPIPPGGRRELRYVISLATAADDAIRVARTVDGSAPQRHSDRRLLYPNPAQSEVWLSLPPNDNNPVDVTITTLQGQQVIRQRALPSDRIVMIDVGGIAPGIYAVRAHGSAFGTVVYIPLVVLR